MNKTLLRIVTLLLVPCLIFGPETASAFSSPSLPKTSNISQTSLFNQQAIVALHRLAFRHGGDEEAAEQVRLVPQLQTTEGLFDSPFFHIVFSRNDDFFKNIRLPPATSASGVTAFLIARKMPELLKFFLDNPEGYEASLEDWDTAN